MTKISAHPPHVRELAIKQLAEGKICKVVKAHLEGMGYTVGLSTINTWRKEACYKYYRPDSKAQRLPTADREDLDAMRRFNRLVGFMRPIRRTVDTSP